MTSSGGSRSGASTRLTLPPSAETGSVARAALRELLDSARVDRETRETTVLLATELVTNAVEHGHGAAYLDAAVDDHTIRLEVTDSSTVVPRPKTDVGELDERGRGLLLIDALATRWGVQSRPDGKTVWCELQFTG
jgi:anti-sigma regulatory factor (Ser/Thr protein kinase)